MRHNMPTSSSNLRSEIFNLKFHVPLDRFQDRHIGPDGAERDAMLKVIGASSLEGLMEEAIPARIRRATPLNLPDGLSEHQFLRELRLTASRNQIFRSFLGLGYYDCVTPRDRKSTRLNSSH